MLTTFPPPATQRYTLIRGCVPLASFTDAEEAIARAREIVVYESFGDVCVWDDTEHRVYAVVQLNSNVVRLTGATKSRFTLPHGGN